MPQAILRKPKDETRYWIPLSFVSRRWGRTRQTIAEWCRDGTLHDFGYDVYRDKQDRWWVGLSDEDMSGWAKDLPVVRDLHMYQKMSKVPIVYCISDGKFVEIGYTNDLLEHFANMQSSTPSKLILVGVREGDQGEANHVHKELKDYWFFGNWYRMDEAVCKWIRTHTKAIDEYFR